MMEASKSNEDKGLTSELAGDTSSDEAVTQPYKALWDFLRERKASKMPSSTPQAFTSTSEASKKKSSSEFDKLFLKPRMIHLMTENMQYIHFALHNEFHQTLRNIPHDHGEQELIQSFIQSLQHAEPNRDFELSKEMTGLLERLLQAQFISPPSFRVIQDHFAARFSLKDGDDLEKLFSDVISSFKQSERNESNWEWFWDILPSNHRANPTVKGTDRKRLKKQSQHCFIERRFKCPVRDRRIGAETNILGPPLLHECVKNFRVSDNSEKTRIKTRRFRQVISKPFDLNLAPVAKNRARHDNFLIDAVFNFLCVQDYAVQPFIRLSNISGGCPLISYEFKNGHEDWKREEGERYLAFVTTIFLWEIIQLTALGENLEKMTESGLPQDGIPIHAQSHLCLHSVLICGSTFHFYETKIATQQEAEAKYQHGRSHKNLPVSFIFKRLTTVTVTDLEDLELVFQFLATITVNAYYNIRPVLVNYGILLQNNNSWQRKNSWINDFDAALTYRTTNGDGDAPYALVPIDNFLVTFADEESDDNDHIHGADSGDSE